MPLIHAVYERGVFRPTEPIGLPDGCEVDVVFPQTESSVESDVAFPNERRVQLIRKRFAEGLSEAESQELQDLQEQSLQLLEKVSAISRPPSGTPYVIRSRRRMVRVRNQPRFDQLSIHSQTGLLILCARASGSFFAALAAF